MRLTAVLPVLSLGLLTGLWSCAGKPPPLPAPSHQNEHGVEIVATPIVREAVQSETLQAAPLKTEALKTEAPKTESAAEARLSPLLSPYSTEGLVTLNQYRTNNAALNDFLLRNRKPDYFFAGTETDFTFQKIYLVYTESQNLYLFDPRLPAPYKKFNPLPPSIQQRVAALPVQRPVYSTGQASTPTPAPAPNSGTAEDAPVNHHSDIEKSLNMRQPQPYLNVSLLYDIPTGHNSDGSIPSYPDLYFLDKPLEELLENQYSIKYDNKKHSLKIIFPQSYDSATLYQNSKLETRKIRVSYDASNGRELSLVVPDFLPGSGFYQATRNNMAKAFASLYQVNLPQDVTGSQNLRMRYQIKLCQSDGREQCAARKGNVITVRAIVMAATLYDGSTLKPIETFVLK